MARRALVEILGDASGYIGSLHRSAAATESFSVAADMARWVFVGLENRSDFLGALVDECRAVGPDVSGSWVCDAKFTVLPSEVSETTVERDGKTSVTSVSRKYALDGQRACVDRE